MSTRSPICAYCFTILSILGGMGLKTNSGAPKQNVPVSPKETAESLRLLEKGIIADGCNAEECPNRL